MKNISKYIAIITLVMLTAISCKDDDVIRFPELEDGVTGRVVLYPERSFVNLDDLANSSVAFDIYTVNTDIQEIVYSVTFNDFDSVEASFPGGNAITVPGSAFAGGKATNAQVSATELAALFNFPGGVSYLEGGDSFTFNATATLQDGRTFSAANSAPSIGNGAAASFTTAFTVYVGCASDHDAIEGTYIATMDHNTPFGIGLGAEVEVQVTFVGPEPFRYEVSDFTAELYTCCGGTQYKGQFYDICGTAILQPSATGFGGVINFVPAGPPFGVPAIDTSTPQTTFVLNWHETNNNILASVSFIKKVD